MTIAIFVSLLTSLGNTLNQRVISQAATMKQMLLSISFVWIVAKWIAHIDVIPISIVSFDIQHSASSLIYKFG